jgi:hypothetical protein
VIVIFLHGYGITSGVEVNDRGHSTLCSVRLRLHCAQDVLCGVSPAALMTITFEVCNIRTSKRRTNYVSREIFPINEGMQHFCISFKIMAPTREPK